MNIFIMMSFIYFGSFLLGKLFEKMKVPWVFSAIFIGIIFSMIFGRDYFLNSEIFRFFANVGMYFLLFMIGLEIEIKEFIRGSKILIRVTLFIILFEALFGTILISFLFKYDLLLSFLIALSFATVGEAILIPILDEFGLLRSKLGKYLIQIGTLDDVLEVFSFILMTFMITGFSPSSIFSVLFLIVLFVFTYILNIIGEKTDIFKYTRVVEFLPLSLSLLFFYLGVGYYFDLLPLSSILAGMGIRAFVSKELFERFEDSIRAIVYGFLAPIFFFEVGIMVDIISIVKNMIFVVIIFVVSSVTKIFASYIAGRKYLGSFESILLGVGLCARLSTGIVIYKILLDYGIIGMFQYSILVASTSIFTLFVPLIFSNLLRKYKVMKS